MNLSNVKPGQKVRVTSLCAKGAIRRRLLDIGLIEGADVECIGVSPFGDPKAYLIRGAVIALREDDASDIMVTANGTDK